MTQLTPEVCPILVYCKTTKKNLMDLCKMYNFVRIGGRGSINMWRNLNKPQASKIRLNHKRPFKTNKRASERAERII